MPLKESPEALTERLYVLTLAVAEAAERADPQQLTALFDQREKVIAALSEKDLPLAVLPRFEDIQAAERTVLSRLFELKAETAREIGLGAKGRSVARAYKPKSAAVSMDSVG